MNRAWDSWRFQVDSGWNRSNYFAVVETVALAGAWQVLDQGKYLKTALFFAFLGLLSTIIWLLNDCIDHTYINYWWQSTGEAKGHPRHGTSRRAFQRIRGWLLNEKAHHIPVSTSLGVISQAQQQACYAGGAVCNTNVANPFYGVLAANTTLGASSTIPAWELMRAYPLFNGVTENSVPSGGSHYNSLNVRVERRLKSLDFVFNYAWSNWVTINSYLNNGSFRDANLWKGLDPSDRQNYVDANVVYPLPSTRKGGVLGALANGWLLDSTVIWGTGPPLSASVGYF